MIDQKTLDEFSKIYDETYNDVLKYEDGRFVGSPPEWRDR